MPAISRALWPTVTVTPYALFQRRDGEALLQRAGDRLLGVDVLAGLGDLARERQMLLVGNGQDDALDRGIGEHGAEIGRRRHA